MTIEIGTLDKDFCFQLAGIDPNTCLWNGHVITKEDGPSIENAIRKRIKELLENEKSPYLKTIIKPFPKQDFRAYQTSRQRDVIQIIDSPHGLIGRKQDGSTVPLGLRKFCKKHTKAIFIGVAAVAVVATVVIISFVTAGAAAAPATAAAVSAIKAALDDDSSKSHSSVANTSSPNRSIPDSLPTPNYPTFEQLIPTQVPTFQPIAPQSKTFNDNPFIPKDPFGYLQQPPVHLYPIAEQNFADPLPPMTFDPEYGPKFIGEPANPTIGDHLRNFGSNIVHETFEAVVDIVSLAPQLIDEIGTIGSKILPESILPKENDPLFKGSRLSHFEKSVNSGHEYIDQIFGTDLAPKHLPDEANPIDFSYGWIPFFPGQITKALPIAEFRQIIAAGREAAVIAEELGISSRQICQLKQSGSLDKTIAETIESIYQNRTMQESFLRIRYAESTLEPYTKQLMSEAEAFARIREVGMPTFPRPIGIPANFQVMLSERGAGIIYTHPGNPHISVRIMPGKPHSPFPHQQKPYVMQMNSGKALDKFGNLVEKRSPEAHIPLDEFIFRNL